MSARLLALLVAVMAAALVAVGCGGDESEGASNGSATTTQTTADGAAAASSGDAPSTETGAAELRAALTGLLEDHVYLAGTAVATGVGSGLDSKAFKAAAGSLDENSKALAAAIASVYGEDAGEQFLELWRRHIGFFVTYTKGKATGDTKLVDKARRQLDGYRREFGAFLASANPNLTADAVAAELKPHVRSLFAAIDAVVAGNTTAFDRLKAASDHMPNTAMVLAGAIAQQYPDQFSGSVESPGAELRAGLTHLLEEHVYLAGLAVVNGVGNGLDSKQFKAAAGTLDDNSKALSEAIASVYGEDAGEQFLELWRRHIGFFVTYTKGKATKDQALVKKARRQLNGYRREFGAFLASANPNLTADAVAEELKPHVRSVFRTIDAVVAGSPSAFDKLRKAAGHMPGTAKVLSGAIAQQFPEKFSS